MSVGVIPTPGDDGDIDDELKFLDVPSEEDVDFFKSSCANFDCVLLLDKEKRVVSREAFVHQLRVPMESLRYHSSSFILNDSMFLVGGNLTFFEERSRFVSSTLGYNFRTGEWRKLASDSAKGIRSHTTNVLQTNGDDHQVLLIGGVSDMESTVEEDLNAEVYILDFSADLRKVTWNKVEITNPIGQRYGHRTVYDPSSNLVYLFGGDTDVTDNSVYELNIRQRKWKQVPVKNNSSRSPQPRYGHIFERLSPRHLLLLFGTCEIETYSDCWIFDLHLNTWREINIESVAPRHGCAWVYKGGSKMYIFGGMDNDYNVTNELMELDLTSWRFTRIDISHKFVKPLFSSTLVQFDNCFYLLGGGSGTWGLSSRLITPLCQLMGVESAKSGQSQFPLFFKFGNSKMENVPEQFYDVIVTCS